MAAGAFAGIAEHTVMYPIDAIKTRMQIINPSPGAVYNGMIQGTYRIATNEGIRNLWRGMSSVVVGAGELPRSASMRQRISYCASRDRTAAM